MPCSDEPPPALEGVNGVVTSSSGLLNGVVWFELE